MYITKVSLITAGYHRQGKYMRIINLTPHSIVILDPSNCVLDPKTRSYKCSGDPVVLRTIPASGVVTRVSTSEVEKEPVNGIPTFAVEFGDVEGLPPSEEGTFYIVSAICKNAAPDRRDLLVPTHMCRNEEGQPIGCLGFAR